MAVVAGIDEAGYGPVLGPLVVCATAFRVSDDRAEEETWPFSSARQSRRAPAPSPVVADSKRLYGGRGDLRILESNLLPFTGMTGSVPERVSGLLALLYDGNAPDLSGYPWYSTGDPVLPRKAAPDDIASGVERLRATLARSSMEFKGARVRILDVAAFNREVGRFDNKSIPLARCVAALMTDLWHRFGSEGVRVYADRQGGRKRYATMLRAAFPRATVTTQVEEGACSEYTITDRVRRMAVSFEVKADGRHPPTALASMFSKYTREVLVEMLNDFWRERVPGLKPTAGYLPDGRRFLADIEACRRAEGIPRDLLERCR